MSKGAKYRDAEWLREQYVDKEKSAQEIAKECACSHSTVHRWLKKHDIQTRRRGNRAADQRLTDAKWLREHYIEKRMTCSEIAEKCGCSYSAVLRSVKKHGIETRKSGRRVPDERLTDGEWLREQYVEKMLSTPQIAEKCDCGDSTVVRWLKKHGIKIRGASGAGQVSDPRLTDREWMREQYVHQQRKLSEIADKCGCSPPTVSRWLKKNGIDVRPRGGSGKRRRERCVPDQRLTDGEWLREQYVEKRMKCKEIAEECGCDESTVQRWVNRHGIETKPFRYLITDNRLTDVEWLREQYVKEERTGYDIAEECGCSFSVVYGWLKKHGIERDYNGGLHGPEHPNWSGGQTPYGPGWNDSKRQAVRERDDYMCQDPTCSVTQDQHLDEWGEKLHVHHLRKARDVDDPEKRNAKENLITLCRDCHKRWEKIADTGLVPQVVQQSSD